MPSSPTEMEEVIVKAIKEKKHREKVKWLKEEKGLKHSHAGILASIFKNGGELVYGNPEKLIRDQYSGKCAPMRPLFDELNKTIQNHFADVNLHVCKGYVSYVAKTQFATIHPDKEQIKLGLAFRDHPAESDLLQALKVKNANDKRLKLKPGILSKFICKNNEFIKLIDIQTNKCRKG